jgi:hypothetical protein
MAAESDLLPILLTTIGIAAVFAIELIQRDQARLDADAAQFHPRDRLHRGLRRYV